MKTFTHFLHAVLFGMVITTIATASLVNTLENNVYAVGTNSNTGMSLIPRTELEQIYGKDYKGSPMYINAIDDFDINIQGVKLQKDEVKNLKAHKKTIYLLTEQDGDYFIADYFMREFFQMNDPMPLILAKIVSPNESVQVIPLTAEEYSGSITIQNIKFPLSDFEYVEVQYSNRDKNPVDKAFAFGVPAKFGYNGLKDEEFLPMNKEINDNSRKLFQYEAKILKSVNVDYTATGKYIKTGFNSDMVNAIDSEKYVNNEDTSYRNQFIYLTATYIALILLSAIGGYIIGRRSTKK